MLAISRRDNHFSLRLGRLAWAIWPREAHIDPFFQGGHFVVAQFALRRHLQLPLPRYRLNQQALRPLLLHGSGTGLSTFEQFVPRGQAEAAFRLFRTVAFYAFAGQDGADLLLEEVSTLVGNYVSADRS